MGQLSRLWLSSAAIFLWKCGTLRAANRDSCILVRIYVNSLYYFSKWEAHILWESDTWRDAKNNDCICKQMNTERSSSYLLFLFNNRIRVIYKFSNYVKFLWSCNFNFLFTGKAHRGLMPYIILCTGARTYISRLGLFSSECSDWPWHECQCVRNVRWHTYVRTVGCHIRAFKRKASFKCDRRVT